MTGPGTIASHRVKAFAAQGGRCFYCAQPMWESKRESSAHAAMRLGLVGQELIDRKCTAEHLIDRASGGPNTRRNIRAACFGCNLSRQMSTVAEHLESRLTHAPLPVLLERIERIKIDIANMPKNSHRRVAATANLTKLRTESLRRELPISGVF